jgi:UDP-N-acetylmuramyl pentapeptide phosphotransferase/UDP-N-acetylglucosamine-1-phosphate transferase
VLIFSPFVVDASVTLARRLLRGERVWQAHKDHYYQRLVRLGWGHRNTALAEYGLMLACAISGLWALMANSRAVVLGLLVLWIVAYAGLMLAIDARWSKNQG